jgi:diguanylate cyclase (GGDEF)-like protein
MNETPAEPRPAPRKTSLGRSLSLSLTIITGIAASLALFVVLLNSDKDRTRSEFQAIAMDRTQAIQAALDEDVVELQLIGSYVTASNELSAGGLGKFAQEFRKFVSRMTQLEPDTMMISYAPRVTSSEREAFQALGRADVDPIFSIQEVNPSGDLVPVADRADYFPLAVAQPVEVGATMLGQDLSMTPGLADAIKRSVSTGAVASTDLADLPLRTSGQHVVWHVLAVSRTANVVGAVPRRGQVIGVCALAIRLDDMVENALKELTPASIDLELRDPTAPSGHELLYYHKSRTSGSGVPEVKTGWMSWQSKVQAGDRSWTLTAYPTPVFLGRHRSPQPWIILGAGLLLTAAGSLFFAGRLRRTLLVEALVDERTHALAREVHKHQELEEELASSRSTLAGQVERLNHRSQEILLLNEMGDTLQACMSTEEAFPVISRYLPHIFPGTSGALYMHDAAGSLYVASAEWGDARPTSGAFKAEDCWALRRGKAHAVTVQGMALPCAHAPLQDGRASLCIPLTAIGRTIGLFHVVDALAEAQALAQSAADRAGLALSNLMLRSDLRQLSIHDPLTGLFNRRYMEETLEIETHRASRRGTPIGLIMLDIDHFKKFNDGYGHAAGDDLLRALGALVSAHLRAGDIACRYGGEEFVLILPDATVEVAAARAEDLRQRVKALEVQSGETRLGPVTISLGVAVFPRHAGGRDALLAAADACLYKAKSAGRDRVVVAGTV